MQGMQILGLVIALTVGAVVMAQMLPIAVSSTNNANQTGWTSTQKSLWSITGILIVVSGIAILAGAIFMHRRR